MNKYYIYLLAMLFSCATIAQPDQWGTKNKKAIKLVEEGMNQSHSINELTGLPNYEAGIPYFDKAIAKIRFYRCLHH